ncbi:DUF3219 family protein [Psychrobacillus soli]|uniref:DUF3219 family protein n=1 Tax=Psychrobacillus soli TaxID=1543965 RepID=A0A544T9S8_9BACI|nr:DUF3219 family protein [Psychrobacillus soli]TQR14108.1 DUF3219 family protein [Psychrobacillus soli]
MINEIILDDTFIKVNRYDSKKVNDLYQISVVFNVTSEDYHDIAVLLYKGTFDVKVPAQHLSFRGSIHQYSTSITNLYEKGQVGEYKLSLLEVQN